ncbi:MAG TPA: exo-alpha-sialidase [Candidatus Hydrogenedentes bacterium]|nr:exo-alpha-sialidase [Candidatus Hydrogenedentota bacterium]
MRTLCAISVMLFLAAMPTGATPLTIIFTDAQDTHDPIGRLEFGANPLESYGSASGSKGMVVLCAIPRPDKSTMVFAVMGPRHEPRRICRAKTFDGANYSDFEEVYVTEPGRWLLSAAIVYDESKHAITAYMSRSTDSGHGIWGFRSVDGGDSWKPLGEGPLFRDHDAFSVIWDARAREYVFYNTTYEAHEKLFPDNLGADRRRVQHIRTSKDGIRWRPNDDVTLASPAKPEMGLIVPDEDDPPETEFYQLNVFAYADRYAAKMLLYAPTRPDVWPPDPETGRYRHGPFTWAEWWVSHDGRNWQRPYRDTYALGEASIWLCGMPLTASGKQLWVYGGKLFGVLEKHLFYVTSKGNAAFSTRPFEMPDTQLLLNAEMTSPFQPSKTDYLNPSYIMAEITDKRGKTIEGYENGKCVFQSLGQGLVPLQWEGRDATELVGTQVRLRLYLRSARIYAVTAAQRSS